MAECFVVHRGLLVGSCGTIKTLERKLVITHLSGHDKCYLKVNVRTSGTRFVHRLVCEAWHPNPDNLEQVNHINGDKLDNRAENLEWVCRSDNHVHSMVNDLHPNDYHLTRDYIVAIRVLSRYSVKHSRTELNDYRIAKAFKVSPGTVHKIANNACYTHVV